MKAIRFPKLIVIDGKDWRASLLQMLVLLSAVVSLPILVNEVLYRDDWLVPVLAWTLLPALALMRNQLPFGIRATLLVGMIMLLGFWTSYTAGLMGSGRMFMGAGTILGAVFLGGSVGLGLFLGSIAALTAIGVAATSGALLFAAPFDTPINSAELWASHIGTYMIAAGVLLLSILYVIRALERTLSDLRSEIEERTAVEASRRETARQLGLIADNLNDVIWTADFDLNCTFITESVTRLKGFTPEENMAMGLADMLAIDSPDLFRAMLADELEHDAERDAGRSVKFETQMATKDGGAVDVEINVSFMRDKTGKPIGLIGVTRDIRDRKRLESAMESVIRGTRLSGQDDFFATLTANLAGVLDVHTVLIGKLIDDDTIECVAVNQNGKPQPIHRRVLRETPCAPVFDQGGLVCIESGFSEHVDVESKVLERQIESFVGIPLVNDSEAVVGVLAAFDDKPLADSQLAEDLLTVFGAHASLELSRQQAEARNREISLQLQQAQKLESVGQLSGGIAHDFNNLLVVIQGFTELAESQAGDDATLMDSLKNIREGTERAASLTRQLLSFSRRQVIDPRPVEPVRLLDNLKSMLSRLLPENIELSLDTSADAGMVKADPGQIEQAIVNLAVNARDAMPAGGRITISTRCEKVDETYARQHAEASPGNYIVLTVADTGEGIPENIRDKIFEPFFTTKPDGLGTGLGLSVVFGIVKQHGGFIDIDSEEDHGTEIHLYLPEAKGMAETARSTGDTSVRQGTETILLVEDEPAVRKLARIFLTRAGYHVIEASDGEEAVAQFRAHRDEISLALLDVVLPKANGREIMEKIVQLKPDIRVLFTSGYAADGIHTNFILRENLVLLPKPYNSEQLLNKVREVLDRETA